MSRRVAPAPILLRPAGPFDFIQKWRQPVWKQCGVYLWSIEHHGAYLASYAGQACGSSTNFDHRIWQEYKWWRAGRDYPVDIEEYKAGRRRELAPRPDGHLHQELDELTPILRLWVMPLEGAAECTQAERWLVARLCQDPASRQFLANRNRDSYRPVPGWPIRIEAVSGFPILGLTVPSSSL